MKKAIIITCIFISLSFLLYFKNIDAQENEQLTKNSIFDIINNIDKSLLYCAIVDGERSLTEENKVDFLVRYLIENRNLYSDKIIKNEQEELYECDDTVYYNFGSIKVEHFNELLNKFFLKIDYDIENYKYYDNGMIKLIFEPIETTYFDSKSILEFEEKDKKYEVLVKYYKKLNQVESVFYVKYQFSSNLKLINFNFS